MTTAKDHVTVRAGSAIGVVKKVLLAGCMLGVGLVVGTFLIGHRIYSKQEVTHGKTGPIGPLVRLRRALVNSLSDETIASGSVFTRWGRTECPGEDSLVYKGYMAGGHSANTGGGNTYLCMTSDPMSDVIPTDARTFIYGAEFKGGENIFGKENTEKLIHHDAVCAVCMSARSVQLMIPGTQNCTEGWNLEFYGYLMSSDEPNAAAKNFVCMDNDPEVTKGGSKDEGGAVLVPVAAACGSLPCPEYVHTEAVTCVVCSK